MDQPLILAICADGLRRYADLRFTPCLRRRCRRHKARADADCYATLMLSFFAYCRYATVDCRWLLSSPDAATPATFTPLARYTA